VSEAPTTYFVTEEFAREKVREGVDALIDVAASSADRPLQPADVKAAMGGRKRFKTTRGYVLWFVCDQLLRQGVIAGTTIRAEVPYAEIAFGGNERVAGGDVCDETVRWAWNDWASRFTRGVRFPVQTGVEGVITFRRAVGNDNLVGLDCEFRPTDPAMEVLIATNRAVSKPTRLERQFLAAALTFFRGRSPSVQKKLLDLLSERRFVAALVVALLSVGWLAYTILHGTTHAFHQDAAKQGQLGAGHAPVGPPTSFMRQEGEAAGIVEIRDHPGAQEVTYRPVQMPKRVRGDLSNLEYEWHVRDTAGHQQLLITDEPRLRFPTTGGVSIQGLFVHPREVVFGTANFRVDDKGKVELLSRSGHPLTEPADAVFTADGLGMASSPSDPAAMTMKISQNHVPLLDKEALARAAGVKKFEYDGVTDALVVLGDDVVWQECLTEELPSLKVLQCEKPTLITHEDDSIAERRVGPRGTFLFHAPRTVAGRSVSLASWAIRNMQTGLITNAGKGEDLRWRFAPGHYSVGCTVMGMSIVKHHTTRADMGKPHEHSRLLPYKALHTVVTVF
jgi:hypothetical protein